MKQLNQVVSSLATLATVAGLLVLVVIAGVAGGDETDKDSFATCLEELKTATNISTDQEAGDDTDPELSLDESIRIYDECLSREGVTLSIHGSLSDAGGTGNSKSDVESLTGTSGSETEVQMKGDGTTSSSESTDLESSVHEFDEMLSQARRKVEIDGAKEHAKIAQDTNAEQLNSSNSLNRTEVDDSSTESDASISAEARHETTMTRQPLDPKDEDIVLKTIREAAELESDPSTKQALWKQYYDYADQK